MGRGDLAYEMYSKICPPKRGMDPDLYCAEPYVMPGNSDGPESPYFGRAGWTWYTGAAAWLFRVSTEWILGVRPTRRGLQVDPCIPSRWDGFRMVRQFRGTTYQIVVENPRHVSRGIHALWLDVGSCIDHMREPVGPAQNRLDALPRIQGSRRQSCSAQPRIAIGAWFQDRRIATTPFVAGRLGPIIPAGAAFLRDRRPRFIVNTNA